MTADEIAVAEEEQEARDEPFPGRTSIRDVRQRVDQAVLALHSHMGGMEARDLEEVSVTWVRKILQDVADILKGAGTW